jgi:hypothetical protein
MKRGPEPEYMYRQTQDRCTNSGCERIHRNREVHLQITVSALHCLQTNYICKTPPFPNACLPPSFPLQTLPNSLSHNGRSTRRQRLQLLRSRLAGTSPWLSIRYQIALDVGVIQYLRRSPARHRHMPNLLHLCHISFRCGPSQCNLRPSHG